MSLISPRLAAMAFIVAGAGVVTRLILAPDYRNVNTTRDARYKIFALD